MKKRSSRTESSVSRSGKSTQAHPPRPAWAAALERQVRPLLAPSVRGGIRPKDHARILSEGIRRLDRAAREGGRGLGRIHHLALHEQPFDAHLLALSPLYRRSRERYVDGGGRFRAALVSSPRTLGSPILLEQLIEYSPIERELVWAAIDPIQGRDPGHLLTVRTYAASLFHEQSHRLLWRILPPPPAGDAGLRRYLNFVESLVIALDMALGDELGPGLASVFYLSGVIYDPGTEVRQGLSRRDYRNYLQAALHATYLLLEMYDPRQVPRAVEALFPGLGKLAARAASRAANLDRGFIARTNPEWQRKHRRAVRQALSGLPGEPLELPASAMDNRLQYLFAERWFEGFGL